MQRLSAQVTEAESRATPSPAESGTPRQSCFATLTLKLATPMPLFCRLPALATRVLPSHIATTLGNNIASGPEHFTRTACHLTWRIASKGTKRDVKGSDSAQAVIRAS